MNRFLALNSLNTTGKTKSFPEKFDQILFPGSTTTFRPRENVEKEVLRKINSYNSTIKVNSIKYLDLEHYFPEAFLGACTGLLIEDNVYNTQEEASNQTRTGDYAFFNEGKYHTWTIFAYVFVTTGEVGSRNSYVSQTVFPELYDYMARYLSSPSYSIANKPILFINVSANKISASSIIRNFAGLTKMGITYLDVFGGSYDPTVDATISLEDFVRKYYEFPENDLETEWFKIDTKTNTVTIKTEKFRVGQYLENRPGGYVGFHGSSEKFYTLNMLPVAIMAVNQDYDLDLSALEMVCKNQAPIEFSENDKKFARIKTVYEYLIKLLKARN